MNRERETRCRDIAMHPLRETGQTTRRHDIGISNV